MAGLALGAMLVLWYSWSSNEVRVSTWRGNSTDSVAGLRVHVAAEVGLIGNTEARQLGQGLPGELRPMGNPLRAANSVLTQGYAVGSHAPAEVWGAIDLALDGNGDGAADPDGTWEHPIYATNSGVTKLTAESYPAGNHIWITNDQYRTGYAHLARFAVSDGQQVVRGDLIGYIGSSGMSSGPHLDYQIWEQQAGQWHNRNPLDFDALNASW